jgi:uncharacterized protein YbbC (DUF1343 family)
VPVTFTPNSGTHSGHACGGVNLIVTDRNVLDAPELGIELAVALRKLYPDDWRMERMIEILGNRSVFNAIAQGEDPRNIAERWQGDLEAFRALRVKYLLYK